MSGTIASFCIPHSAFRTPLPQCVHLRPTDVRASRPQGLGELIFARSVNKNGHGVAVPDVLLSKSQSADDLLVPLAIFTREIL